MFLGDHRSRFTLLEDWWICLDLLAELPLHLFAAFLFLLLLLSDLSLSRLLQITVLLQILAEEAIANGFRAIAVLNESLGDVRRCFLS